MQSLAGTNCPEKLLKSLWLQRLPHHTQQILSVSSAESLADIANMADKISEIPSNNIYAVSTNSEDAQRKSVDKMINELSMKMSSLMAEVNELRQQNSNHRSRSRSKSNTRFKNQNQICYYHNRFKSKAQKCTQPCSFKQNQNHPN